MPESRPITSPSLPGHLALMFAASTLFASGCEGADSDGPADTSAVQGNDVTGGDGGTEETPSTGASLGQLEQCDGPTGANGLIPGACNKTWLCDTGDLGISCSADSGASGPTTCSCLWGSETWSTLHDVDLCSALYGEPAQLADLVHFCGFDSGTKSAAPEHVDRIPVEDVPGEEVPGEEVPNEEEPDDGLTCGVSDRYVMLFWGDGSDASCMEASCCEELGACAGSEECGMLLECRYDCLDLQPTAALACLGSCDGFYPQGLVLSDAAGQCSSRYSCN